MKSRSLIFLIAAVFFTNSGHSQEAEIKAVLNVGKPSDFIVESTGIDDPIKAPPIFATDLLETVNDTGSVRTSFSSIAGAGCLIPGFSTFQASVRAFATGGANGGIADSADAGIEVEDRFFFKLADGGEPTESFIVRLSYYTGRQMLHLQPALGPETLTNPRVGFSYQMRITGSADGGERMARSYGRSVGFDWVTEEFVQTTSFDGNTGQLSKAAGQLEITVRPNEDVEFRFSGGIDARTGSFAGEGVAREDLDSYTYSSGGSGAFAARFNIEAIESTGTEEVVYAGSLSGINYQTDLLKQKPRKISVKDGLIEILLENSELGKRYRLVSSDDLGKPFVPVPGVGVIEGTGDDVVVGVRISAFDATNQFFKFEDLGPLGE